MNEVEMIKISIPILLALIAWLWKMIKGNMDAANKNANRINLINQSLEVEQTKIGGMEDKVSRLSYELTEVKFNLQAIDHKQDKNHIEILGEIRNIYNFNANKDS